MSYIDSTFIECYEENISKIQKALQEYSGKHNINPEKASSFIESQISPIRRTLAKTLIDNTIYITLQDTFNIVEQLILRLYNEHELGKHDNIYFYSGKKEKSFYFLNVIALFFIKKHGFKIPIFVSNLDVNTINNDASNPIVVLDDVSYSGSQISQLMNDIYYDECVKNKKKPPNIFIALIALNDFSLAELSMVPTELLPTSTKLYASFIQSPFKLIYLSERLYKPLILKLGIELYCMMTILFSVWTLTEGYPFVSLYLDHKMADEVSTYKPALIYGPISMQKLPISNLFFIDGTFYGEVLDGFRRRYDRDTFVKNQLLEQFNRENNTKYTNISEELVQLIIQKIIDLDIIDKDLNTTETIKFVPFIDNCNLMESFPEDIKAGISKMDYFSFFVPKDCYPNKDCAVPYVSDTVREYLISLKINVPDRKNIQKYLGYITNNQCPASWYKKGEYAMSCVKGGRPARKTRRRVSKSKRITIRKCKSKHKCKGKQTRKYSK